MGLWQVCSLCEDIDVDEYLDFSIAVCFDFTFVVCIGNGDARYHILYFGNDKLRSDAVCFSFLVKELVQGNGVDFVQCKHNGLSVFLVVVQVFLHNDAVSFFVVRNVICNIFRQCIQILNAFQRLDSQMFCKLYISVAVNEGRRCENALFDEGVQIGFVHNIICKDLF